MMTWRWKANININDLIDFHLKNKNFASIVQ